MPSVLFYENPQHTAILRDLARDFRLGSHLLLIGNQGVGKNKLVDKFLQLVNRPRHYMQLHRLAFSDIKFLLNRVIQAMVQICVQGHYC